MKYQTAVAYQPHTSDEAHINTDNAGQRHLSLIEPNNYESLANESGSKSFNNKIDRLRAVALSLVHEVKALSIAPTRVDVQRGIAFYDEVQRFEADLIRQALIITDGHQVRAARLLGLGVTTLNSMIKRYNISPHNPTLEHVSSNDEQ